MEKNVKKPSPLDKITIPNYTLGEELVSSISHGIGAVLGLVGMILLIIKSNSTADYVSAIIYGLSMILLYTTSCVYHGLAKNKGKKVMRVIDHSVIYFLIVGTYTPFCLITMGNTAGYIIVTLDLILGVAGVLFSCIDLKKYAKWGMACYILMGWLIVFATSYIYKPLGREGFLLLLLGGIAYTLGAVLYGIGKKYRYIHSVFHFFVLLGSVLHYLTIYNYVF